DLDTTVIAWKGGCRRFESPNGTAGEFKGGDDGVFGFDLMKGGEGSGVDPCYIAEEPQQQGYCVNALVQQGSADIKIPGSPPVGFAVVVRGPVPLDAGADEDRVSYSAG